MRRIETACVIIGFIVLLCPVRIKIEQPVNIADIFVALGSMLHSVIAELMIILPLYFNFWKK